MHALLGDFMGLDMASTSNSNISNFHALYYSVTSQHWTPNSERFAGGDNLMTAIYRGWQIEKCVAVHHTYNGMREVKVFEFTLSKNGETMTMPVIHNPYIERFLNANNVEVIDVGHADHHN